MVVELCMTTPLEKTVKRELPLKGQTYIVAISPDGLKLTLKGHRKGLELKWESLISGEAALAVALNASVGQFAAEPDAPADKPSTPKRTQAISRGKPAKKGAVAKSSRKRG
jgi:hypothetical protein